MRLGVPAVKDAGGGPVLSTAGYIPNIGGGNLLHYPTFELIATGRGTIAPTLVLFSGRPGVAWLVRQVLA